MTNTISKIIHNGDEFEFDTSSVSGITTTQPSNPSEGAMYYDTTNDVVKVYDGTNWNVVGDDAADINTKTFYLSSTNDLTTAQAALDWYLAGKNPIIIYSDKAYIIRVVTSSVIEFASVQSVTLASSTTILKTSWFKINYSGTTVSSLSANDTTSPVLQTNQNYSTPYTPTYAGSPATKKYVDDTVASAKSSGATAPSNPTEGQLWYDTTNDVLKVYDGTNWVEVGKEYSAGEGISIGNVTKNGRQGPSPKGFHVPSITEWEGVNTIMTSLSLTTGNNWKANLHMPFAGRRNYSDAAISSNQGDSGYYWSSSPYSESSSTARRMYLYSSYVSTDNGDRRAYGASIRCFKDSYVTPDSSWTVVQGTLGSAGIFWNQSEGLISITNGTTGYTMMDKNLGATTVYNDGDTLTEANMGYMYQWGNNYGFPSIGTITNTSSTQVNTSTYGPTNPYSSDIFITGSNDWSSAANDDLWGDTTGTYTLENAITNTGVLSVNGQTGDVTVNSGIPNDTTGTTSAISGEWVGTQAEFDALSSYGNKIYNIIE